MANTSNRRPNGRAGQDAAHPYLTAEHKQLLKDDCDRLFGVLFGEECSRTKIEVRYDERRISTVIAGPKKGSWNHKASGAGGGEIQAIQYALNLDYEGAVQWALDYLGSRAVLPFVRKEPEPTKPAEDRSAIARQWWQEAHNTHGTSAQRYVIEERGIPAEVERALSQADVIRFHARHQPRLGVGRGRPALMIKATDLNGTVHGIQAIHLDRNGRKVAGSWIDRRTGKERKANAKFSCGDLAGNGAVGWLSRGDGDVVLSEGPEDGFTLYTARPDDMVGVAFGGLCGIVRAVPAGRRIVLAAQNDDPDSQAAEGFRKACELLVKAGHEVWIARPPAHIKDANDLLRAEGIDAVHVMLADAQRFSPPSPTPPPPRGTTEGIPAYWSANARPVSDVRPELAAAVEKAARDAVSIAIKTTPGSGKTTAEIALARKRSGWILFAEPNHDIARQVVADMKGFGLHLAGRAYEYEPGKTLCQIPEDAEAAHAARLNVTQELCKFCPFKGDCEYFNRLDQIKNAMKTKPAGAIVTVHNFYSQDMARDIDTDMIDRIVIDERIDLDRDTAFPADRLDRESHDAIFGRKVLDAFDAAGHLRLTGFLAEDLTHRAEVEGRSVKLKLDPEMNFEQRCEAIRKHAEQLKLEFRWKFQKLFTTMAREIKAGREVSNQIVLVRNESDPKNGTTPRDYIHIYSKANVSTKLAGKPIHYIDGTLDQHHARALLGDGCAFVALDAVRNLTVTQVCDAVFSKNHLLFRKDAKANRNRIYTFILALGKTHRKILIGVPKTCRDVMETEWQALVADMQEAPIVSWIHMNKGRGVNAYETYDCAVVVGREEPSVRTIEALARMRFPDTPITPLPSGPKDGRRGPRWPTRLQGYTMKDGRKLGVEVSFHPDPLCQSVLEQIREGEIVQIVDRLRGVNRQEAPSVYLLTNVPTEIPVDRLVPWRELRTETCGAKWWQTALQIGGGVAPLRWEWLVENGVFETETQAAQAVSRLARQTRHYANNTIIGVVSCLPNLTTFRTLDQHGRDSWVLAEHGMNDDDTAARLARHVGKLHSFNGRIIGAEPAAHEPAQEAMIDDSIILDPCGYEPDEPAPEHSNVPLDTEEGARKLKETLMWISIRNTNLSAAAAALAGRAGLETWPGADDAPDLGREVPETIQPRSGNVSHSVLEW